MNLQIPAVRYSLPDFDSDPVNMLLPGNDHVLSFNSLQSGLLTDPFDRSLASCS